MTAVIGLADHQRDRVERLVAHCRALDGTEVRVIPVSESNRAYLKKYPNAPLATVQADGLLHCARQLKGEPFFWLEPDSIPLRAGWLSTIAAEYANCGKPFLISADTHPPHDLVGGIGIYPPNTHWLLPEFYPQHSWDLWMVRHLPDMMAFTPLIQHTYGRYNAKGDAAPHIFPRDRKLIRPDALVFHRDRFQGLITGAQTFLHSGDLGDIISALPVMRQLGGGALVLTDHKPGLNPPLRPMHPRFSSIEPLLAAQPYLTSVIFDPAPRGITCDFTHFRNHLTPNRCLSLAHALNVGCYDVDFTPWLTAPPSPATHGRIVVARSARYHNPQFPWAKLVKYNGNRMLFCGLPDEHADFVKRFGRVEYLPTANLLELASAIAGSTLFIGNQSCPCWIAMGLGHPLIQETRASGPDSMVLRSNAKFVPDNGAKIFGPSYRLL